MQCRKWSIPLAKLSKQIFLLLIFPVTATEGNFVLILAKAMLLKILLYENIGNSCRSFFKNSMIIRKYAAHWGVNWKRGYSCAASLGLLLVLLSVHQVIKQLAQKCRCDSPLIPQGRPIIGRWEKFHLINFQNCIRSLPP